MINDWPGYVINEDIHSIDKVKKQSSFWFYDLITKHEFIDLNSVFNTLSLSNQKNIELLHIDIDSNDFY